MADERRAFQRQRADEFGEYVGVVGQGEPCGRVGRLAAAWTVPRDDREITRQRIELPPPDPAVAEESVEQQERRALSRPPVADAKSSDVDRPDQRHTRKVTIPRGSLASSPGRPASQLPAAATPRCCSASGPAGWQARALPSAGPRPSNRRRADRRRAA